MGFPSYYTEAFLPKLLIKALSFLCLLRTFILIFIRFLGLSRLVEPEICWPEPGPEFKSASASIIQEMLPIMKFSDVLSGLGSEQPESCAVCLYDFRNHDEIRRLTNCPHIFHRGCVDRWMDNDQRTCPLCRTPFIPVELMEVFNKRLEAAASSILEFGSEFSAINNFL